MSVVIDNEIFEMQGDLTQNEEISKIKGNGPIKGVILTYFDTFIGPKQFYSNMNSEISEKITNLIDINSGDKAFIYGVGDFLYFNKIFEIESKWARGKIENLMISIVIDESIYSQKLRQIILYYLDNAIEMLTSDDTLYKGLYSEKDPKYAKAEEINREEINSKYKEINYKLKSLSKFLISIVNY